MALSPTEESLVRQLIAQNPALLNLASSESTIISKLGATKVSLSDLSAATSLSDADLALVRQGLNDKSFAMSVLLDYVENNLTLPSASETVAGVVEIATTAEAQAMTDDVRSITPKKLADALKGSNQSLSSNGYQRLPGGLIIQWGILSIDSSGNGTWTFPIAFPNSVLKLWGISAGAATFISASAAPTGTTSGAFAARDASGVGVTSNTAVFAIGF